MDNNKLIKCYRELGLSKTETLFLLEISVHDGQYKESEATWKYSSSTIKKLRQGLYEKALLDWTTKPIFGDTIYQYNLSAIDKKLHYVEENKIDKARQLVSYFRAMGDI